MLKVHTKFVQKRNAMLSTSKDDSFESEYDPALANGKVRHRSVTGSCRMVSTIHAAAAEVALEYTYRHICIPAYVTQQSN